MKIFITLLLIGTLVLSDAPSDYKSLYFAIGILTLILYYQKDAYDKKYRGKQNNETCEEYLTRIKHETAIKKKEEIEREAREKALNIAADEELKEYIINKYPNNAQFIYQKFKSKQPFIGASQDEIKYILGEADTIDSQGLWKYGDLGPRGGGRKWKYVLRFKKGTVAEIRRSEDD